MEMKLPELVKDLGMLYPTEFSKTPKRYGIYKCDYCRKNFKIATGTLKEKKNKSCGCYKKPRKGTLQPLLQEDYPLKLIEDLGRIKATENSKQLRRHAIWECPTCKKHFKSNTNSVKRGLVKQCRECANIDIGKACKIHGYGQEDRLFRIWAGILTRVTNYNRKSAHRYVGLGVTICDEWKNNFMAFREWALENGYTDTLTIDKDLLCEINGIEPKIYSPDTCLWLTSAENTSIRFLTSTKDKIDMLNNLLWTQLQEEKEN